MRLIVAVCVALLASTATMTAQQAADHVTCRPYAAKIEARRGDRAALAALLNETPARCANTRAAIQTAMPKGPDPEAERLKRELESAQRERAALERKLREASAAPPARVQTPPAPRPRPTPSAAPVDPVAAAARAAAAEGSIAARRFRECADCPEMVAVPGGDFDLGSPPESEVGRQGDEGPRMRVSIRPFAVSRHEITRGEYAVFTRETGRAVGGNCFAVNSAGSWEQQQTATWQSPGFAQGSDHPVVCVSWEDAQAFVAWLNEKVGGTRYRLLTESEWEYATRARTTSRFWWGDGDADLCAYANGADQTAKAKYTNWTGVAPCADGHVHTAPVGFSGRENRFGLSDMAGNAWEWVEDCYHATYDLTPRNGAANTTGACSSRVVRGGSWYDRPQFLRSADRDGYNPSRRVLDIGFRVARTVSPSNP